MENKITAEMVEKMKPSLIVSFNYRHLIKPDILRLMPGRVINLHTSYLPYNRGSSPNVFSFLDNTPKGVTIHFMDEGLDTGDILCRKELFFEEEKETFASSYEKLLSEIKALFRENWRAIKAGGIKAQKQEAGGSYHRMKELEEIRKKAPLDWNMVIADYKKTVEHP